MSEIKKPRVRAAKPRDIGLFKKLWKLYLEERFEQGGVILPSDENVETYTNLFKLYTNPDLPEDMKIDGIVLFIGEVALIMCGDPDMPFETRLGKTAYAFGVYVMPDQRRQGLFNLLYEEAKKRLNGFGFEHVTGSILESNTQGIKALERSTGQELQKMPDQSFYVRI